MPIQVDRSVFLAAQLRESLREVGILQARVATLQAENAELRKLIIQSELVKLDQEFQLDDGMVLQRREDGTYWRMDKAE